METHEQEERSTVTPRIANDKLLTSNEVADLLGVHRGRLANERKKKREELPYFKMDGRIRYWQSDVQRYIDRCIANSA